MPGNPKSIMQMAVSLYAGDSLTKEFMKSRKNAGKLAKKK